MAYIPVHILFQRAIYLNVSFSLSTSLHCKFNEDMELGMLHLIPYLQPVSNPINSKNLLNELMNITS